MDGVGDPWRLDVGRRLPGPPGDRRCPMLQVIASALGVVVLVVAGLGVVYVVGMRRKSPVVVVL